VCVCVCVCVCLCLIEWADNVEGVLMGTPNGVCVCMCVCVCVCVFVFKRSVQSGKVSVLKSGVIF